MKALKMENYTDFWSDIFLSLITFAGTSLGISLIPVAESESIIQILLSPTAEQNLDISIKLFILSSTTVSTITGSIVIYKSIRSLRK